VVMKRGTATVSASELRRTIEQDAEPGKGISRQPPGLRPEKRLL
jgi:hypothetical protein